MASNVMEISGTGALDDPEHPVFMAFDWLVEEDTLYICPEDPNFAQRYALAVLYFATRGDQWTKCRRDGLTVCSGESFLSGAHECEWGGVTCDSLNRVTNLNLDEGNLKGVLPDELWVLEYCEELDFDSNELVGTVPQFIKSLKNLERLDLDRNHLSGQIPDCVWDTTTLKFVDLDRNIISGTISTKIGRLTDLILFQVDFNQLIGTIPTEAGSLEHLQYFSVLGNGFDYGAQIPQ